MYSVNINGVWRSPSFSGDGGSLLDMLGGVSLSMSSASYSWTAGDGRGNAWPQYVDISQGSRKVRVKLSSDSYSWTAGDGRGNAWPRTATVQGFI